MEKITEYKNITTTLRSYILVFLSLKNFGRVHMHVLFSKLKYNCKADLKALKTKHDTDESEPKLRVNKCLYCYFEVMSTPHCACLIYSIIRFADF